MGEASNKALCHILATSPGEGVGPVHSREVPLPLTRDEIGPLSVAHKESLLPLSVLIECFYLHDLEPLFCGSPAQQ